MTQLRLDPGLYLNLFLVTVPEEDVDVMTAPRASHQDLRSLRGWIEEKSLDAQVYADESVVYGYGPDATRLDKKGFESGTTHLADMPRLTTRLITEGMADALRSEGYELRFGRGRWYGHRPDRFATVANGNVRVHGGYDLRASFWRDADADQIAFGLIVDVTWILRDTDGRPISISQVSQRYGYEATIAVGQVQGEYLRGTSKINSEVSRQRLHDHILPFVRGHPTFDLPCGGTAQLQGEPIRVVLGGEEQ